MAVFFADTGTPYKLLMWIPRARDSTDIGKAKRGGGRGAGRAARGAGGGARGGAVGERGGRGGGAGRGATMGSLPSEQLVNN